VVRVDDRLLEEVAQPLPQYALQSRAHHALRHVVQVLCAVCVVVCVCVCVCVCVKRSG
jgi:hypothetical protein